MSQKGIYVEILIAAPIDSIWKHTQTPDLHERWDLRFSSITYLPKDKPEDPQRFVYETRIGLGFSVVGQGESTGTREKNLERSSALRFWSDNPFALIREGSGYWRYIPTPEGVRFLTWYDYQPRWGWAGWLIDRAIFRPLMGWATAWSFDRLRLWLEAGQSPERSRQIWTAEWVARSALSLAWIYQGLVPKLLFPDTGEVAILSSIADLAPYANLLVALAGIGEILWGLLLLIWRDKAFYLLNAVALAALLLGATVAQRSLFVLPFNPVSLTLTMAGLAITLWCLHGLSPTAATCKRRST